MRVLLDECLPRKLKADMAGHEVATVPEMGWAGKRNGELLSLAAPHFDAFITVDQNLRVQQNLSGLQLAMVVLSAPDNRLETLRPLMPGVVHNLQTIQAGDVVRIAIRATDE